MSGELTPEMLEGLTDDQLYRLVNDIQAVIYTRKAQAGRPVLEHEPGAAAETEGED